MSERVVLVAAVGEAVGAKAAAAALACADSDPDRPGLLIDVGGRAPRPTLVASTGARELEERLAVHLPQLRAASRGQTCHLAVADDPAAFEHVRAALPLVRESVAVIHLPSSRMQDAFAETGLRSSAALLRADLAADRALTALAVRDLIGHGLRVAVLKQALAWIPARRAHFGVLPPEAPGGLSRHLRERLFADDGGPEHPRHADFDDAEAHPEGVTQQQREGNARTRWRRGLHRDAQRPSNR